MKTTTKCKRISWGRVMFVALALTSIVALAVKATAAINEAKASTTFADTLTAKIHLMVTYISTGEIDKDVLKEHPELSGFIAGYKSEVDSAVEKKVAELAYDKGRYEFFSTMKNRIH